MDFIEPCFSIGHNLSLICQMTSEDIKHQLIIIFAHVRVPGEIKRSRDLRGGRWSWTLTFAQKRSWVGRWSWADQVGRLLLRVVQVVRQQRCNGHCLSDSVQHSSWKSNCAVHTGDTALTLPLFWRRSTVSPVFFGRFPRSSQSPCPLSHSVPVPNRSSRLRGR